jgi:hypothetical protein
MTSLYKALCRTHEMFPKIQKIFILLFIFLKPLPVGEHTVRYVNDVRETTLGAGNTNNADITYSLKVK